MIKAGVYTASIVSHAISETRKGDLQAVVEFSFSQDNEQKKIKYYGSFSEKAIPYTIKNLITLGLKGNNPAGPLEVGKEVEIVVSTEIGEDNQERAKVKFINKLGEVKNKVSPELAMAKLAKLEAHVIQARGGFSNSQDDDIIPF